MKLNRIHNVPFDQMLQTTSAKRFAARFKASTDFRPQLFDEATLCVVEADVYLQVAEAHIGPLPDHVEETLYACANP